MAIEPALLSLPLHLLLRSAGATWRHLGACRAKGSRCTPRRVGWSSSHPVCGAEKPPPAWSREAAWRRHLVSLEPFLPELAQYGFTPCFPSHLILYAQVWEKGQNQISIRKYEQEITEIWKLFYVGVISLSPLIVCIMFLIPVPLQGGRKV